MHDMVRRLLVQDRLLACSPHMRVPHEHGPRMAHVALARQTCRRRRVLSHTAGDGGCDGGQCSMEHVPLTDGASELRSGVERGQW